jgi:hypothetical protein
MVLSQAKIVAIGSGFNNKPQTLQHSLPQMLLLVFVGIIEHNRGNKATGWIR